MPSGKNPLMLMMALSVPGAAQAIGLGDIHVDSALNEHFAAEIDIVGATALELADLRASVANRETFLRYGADRPAFLSSATFKVVQDSHGRPVLAVRSSESFTEPVVNFLVDLNWHNGELVRQYTVLLDPANYSHSPGATLALAPPTVAATPAVTAEAVTPIEAAVPAEASDAPPTAAQSARKMTHIKVGAKATLRGIAWRVGERSPSDLQKMMIAIFRANPTAFDGNINRLHLGAVLTIPAHAELAAISKTEARQEFRAQMAAWRTGARVAASTEARPAQPAESPAAPPVESTAAAAAPAAAANPVSEPLDQRVKSLEKELTESKGTLQGVEDQLFRLREQEARAEKPVFAPKPVAAEVPLAVVVSSPRAKSDFMALSIVGGLGVLASALAALYFRLRRRALPPQAPSANAHALKAADPAADAAADAQTIDDFAETVPGVLQPQMQQSAPAPAAAPTAALAAAPAAPVWERTPDIESDDTRPDIQAILEPRTDESTQPLLPIISTGEPAGRSNIAGSSSRADSQDVTVNMRADAGTVRLNSTRLDYNLLDLDMTAQHVQMPSALNEQVVMKERRTNLADVLRLAIEREPDRHDLRIKLLELYYSVASTNRQAFLEVVQKFARERQHLPPEQWERIAAMGRQIASESPMFVDETLIDAADADMADCA